MSMTPSPAAPHSLIEDLLAIAIGALLVSLGIALFKHAGLLTGSMAGLAFLIHYLTAVPFGLAFFVLNLPFYWLAWQRKGKAFTLKTFCAVALVSLLSGLHDRFLPLGHPDTFYSAVTGGLMMGVGFIVLFRHQASLGGINILALYLQERHGIRAGTLQMAIDIAIIAASLFVVSPIALLASVLGAIALNLVIAMNHRPGRYLPA